MRTWLPKTCLGWGGVSKYKGKIFLSLPPLVSCPKNFRVTLSFFAFFLVNSGSPLSCCRFGRLNSRDTRGSPLTAASGTDMTGWGRRSRPRTIHTSDVGFVVGWWWKEAEDTNRKLVGNKPPHGLTFLHASNVCHLPRQATGESSKTPSGKRERESSSQN